MQKRLFSMVLVALVALSAVLVVSAQETTVEPPIDVTVEVTLGATGVPTSEATLPPPTNEGTAEATDQMTSAPPMDMTPEATTEAPVAAETEMAPVANGALLRVAYFAPDMENVDVYLDNVLIFKNLKFPSVSRFISLEPGTYNVQIVWTGSPVSDAVASANVSVSDGTAQTLAVIGAGDTTSLNTALISEDYSDLLPGTGGFTFVNAVPGSSAVNLLRDNVVYYAQIEFPGPDVATSSSSLRVDSGTFDISVVSADDETTVLAENVALELPENAYTLVALIGTAGNARLFTVVTDEADVEVARGDLPKPGRILDALRANENLTSFADALDAAGLTDQLSSTGEYTVFAPANFVIDDNAIDVSAAALSGYIVEGKYTSAELVDVGTLTAIDGSTLTITVENNKILVNRYELIDVNIAATNGVIHMLGASWDS